MKGYPKRNSQGRGLEIPSNSDCWGIPNKSDCWGIPTSPCIYRIHPVPTFTYTDAQSMSVTVTIISHDNHDLVTRGRLQAMPYQCIRSR